MFSLRVLGRVLLVAVLAVLVFPLRQASAADVYALDKGFQHIEVQWVSGRVNVRVVDGDRITFSESARRTLNVDERLTYQASGDKLTISYGKSTSVFSFLSGGIPSKDLELLIPASLAPSKLTLVTVSGPIVLDAASLAIDDLIVESVSGSVDVTNAGGERLRGTNISGATRVEGAWNQISLESVSGSSTLTLHEMPQALRGQSVSGGFRVVLPQGEDFFATLDSISGRIHCPSVNASGKTVAIGNSGSQLKFETVSGGVTIDLESSAGSPMLTKPDRASQTTPTAPTAPTASPVPTDSDGAGSSGGRKF